MATGNFCYKIYSIIGRVFQERNAFLHGAFFRLIVVAPRGIPTRCRIKEGDTQKITG